MTDIVAGRISVWLATLGGALGNIQAGKVRALAVSGQRARRSAAGRSDLHGAGRRHGGGIHLVRVFVPKGTPKTIIAKLNRDVEQILTQPAMQGARRHARLPLDRRPAREARRFLKSETAKWAEVAKSARRWLREVSACARSPVAGFVRYDETPIRQSRCGAACNAAFT